MRIYVNRKIKMQPNVQAVKPMDTPFWGQAKVSQGGENHNAVPCKLSLSGESVNRTPDILSLDGESPNRTQHKVSPSRESSPVVSDWFSPVGEQKLEFQTSRL
jgi:hypothetical protein